MQLIDQIKRLARRPKPYRSLIEVEISAERLKHNLVVVRSVVPRWQVAPVLKSNAYGHGLNLVASVVDKENVPFVVVDSYFEALSLRRNGFRSPILLVGFVFPEDILNNKLPRVAFTITSLEQLRQVVERLSRPQAFHLKIDTGMHRQGLLIEEVETAMAIIKNNANFILEGVCSHFADADSEAEAFTLQQIEKWNELGRLFRKNFENIKYFHVSASAGLYYYEKIRANCLRLGIGLYGFNVSKNKSLDLRPALSMKTVITGVKNLKKGETVGYGHSFTAPRDMTVATIPVGYYEGLDRRLSSVGFVKVKGILCPIVGRVSMNISSIDVSSVPIVALGDEVEVISANKQDPNSIDNMARLAGTIPYELLVHLPGQLKRTSL